MNTLVKQFYKVYNKTSVYKDFVFKSPKLIYLDHNSDRFLIDGCKNITFVFKNPMTTITLLNCKNVNTKLSKLYGSINLMHCQGCNVYSNEVIPWCEIGFSSGCFLWQPNPLLPNLICCYSYDIRSNGNQIRNMY